MVDVSAHGAWRRVGLACWFYTSLCHITPQKSAHSDYSIKLVHDLVVHARGIRGGPSGSMINSIPQVDIYLRTIALIVFSLNTQLSFGKWELLYILLLISILCGDFVTKQGHLSLSMTRAAKCI